MKAGVKSLDNDLKAIMNTYEDDCVGPSSSDETLLKFCEAAEACFIRCCYRAEKTLGKANTEAALIEMLFDCYSRLFNRQGSEIYVDRALAILFILEPDYFFQALIKFKTSFYRFDGSRFAEKLMSLIQLKVTQTSDKWNPEHLNPILSEFSDLSVRGESIKNANQVLKRGLAHLEEACGSRNKYNSVSTSGTRVPVTLSQERLLPQALNQSNIVDAIYRSYQLSCCSAPQEEVILNTLFLKTQSKALSAWVPKPSLLMPPSQKLAFKLRQAAIPPPTQQTKSKTSKKQPKAIISQERTKKPDPTPTSKPPIKIVVEDVGPCESNKRKKRPSKARKSGQYKKRETQAPLPLEIENLAGDLKELVVKIDKKPNPATGASKTQPPQRTLSWGDYPIMGMGELGLQTRYKDSVKVKQASDAKSYVKSPSTRYYDLK